MMIRVLHMIGSLNIGGSQAMVMNLYRNIDRSRIQFDFIIDRPNELYYANEITKLGGKIYTLPVFNGKNICEVKNSWKMFFEKHKEYKILHSHVRSYASIYLPIAKKYGLKTIIHSHSTSNGKGIKSYVKRVMQYPLRFQADYFMGCSELAGKWLFGSRITESNKYHMIQNAIDTEEYLVNPEIRQRYRKELDLDENIVYGHVGRFHESKNHMFLLDVFQGIHILQPESKLILVGDGELRSGIEKKIQELNLGDSVILMGNRNDVYKILMAFDCFLFPSRWEGLPVTVVEAQASGLHCLISDTITKDVNISELVSYLPIDCGVDMWIKTAIDISKKRINVRDKIIKSGFDVSQTTLWITEFYRKLQMEV